MFSSTNTYVNNKKLVIDMKYTNAEFWEVMDYKFIEGKPYTAQQIKNGERVAVISEDIKNKYFGKGDGVVGKYIEADNVQYRVSGVVKSVPITMLVSYGDLFVPYTVSKKRLQAKVDNGKVYGGYTCEIERRSAKDKI